MEVKERHEIRRQSEPPVPVGPKIIKTVADTQGRSTAPYLREMPSLRVHRCRYVTAQSVSDGTDGVLSILTKGREIPFHILRVYYISGFNTAASVRGKHAHRSLEQVLFCVSGMFTLHLDDGIRQQTISLTAGPTGVWLGPALWHTMECFSKDCVIIILASAPYDERDYIRDYDEFRNYANDCPVR